MIDTRVDLEGNHWMSPEQEQEDEASQSDEEVQDDTNTLITEWETRTARLRHVADQARWLAARLTSDRGGDLELVVQDFRDLAGSAERSEFESLLLSTVGLHHRGVGVLDPDRGPVPLSSPFVRRMPDEQAEIEAQRSARQVRHVTAYVNHVQQAIEHFVHAWTALVDGALSCDWDMLDDEFPKLAVLLDEVNRAWAIWYSVSR
ncbi:hypothetical protein Lesp02_71630 [Lentzea sp. NBRC 105346]|uniref:hypothetical protein n=1 Tax=Lentzea sp. NBRC 105346 TaxID=3032205 RepID=UPI0024A1DC37|nr:hypothetical protein [Lentzea sp. NBRC 105346]GLZ34976.1 hypothetical protein Lesp02_71630 [Lentzea sp. NBRC 105346]